MFFIICINRRLKAATNRDSVSPSKKRKTPKNGTKIQNVCAVGTKLVCVSSPLLEDEGRERGRERGRDDRPSR